MKTLQDVVDKVKAHLVAQGRRCLDADKLCRYRGEDGTSCAVGCLITDEYYKDSFEGIGIDGPVFKAVKCSLGIYPNKECSALYRVLSKLQAIHDASPPEDWPTLDKVISQHHNLSLPIDC